jgi:hypothetical protein
MGLRVALRLPAMTRRAQGFGARNDNYPYGKNNISQKTLLLNK